MSAVPGTEPVAAYLGGLRTQVEAGLERVLISIGAPPLITDAMRYSLMAGGKRLRPCLTLAAAEAAGATAGISAARARDLALPAAVAVEMIHSYSLIHDDLPAMDNDELRRGRPTSHVVHGDGLAILAGDGLLTEAFAVIAGPASSVLAAERGGGRSLAPAARRAAAGGRGRCGGNGRRTGDRSGCGRTGARSHRRASIRRRRSKTCTRERPGALIAASATIGAVLAGAREPVVDAIGAYARELGLAFQIIDDVLDVEGSNEALGKTAGKDAAAGKPTYPALYGLEESRRKAAACVDRATAALAAAGVGGRLADIAAWSLERRA